MVDNKVSVVIADMDRFLKAVTVYRERRVAGHAIMFQLAKEYDVEYDVHFYMTHEDFLRLAAEVAVAIHETKANV